MNAEAQRIAIAEARGYAKCQWRYYDGDERLAVFSGRSNISDEIVAIPNYLGDLNACHEFEGSLKVTNGEWARYGDTLSKICGGASHHGAFVSRLTIRATAAQRCEAFLRTVGKWVDA